MPFYPDQTVIVTALDGAAVTARVHQVTDDDGEPYVGLFLLVPKDD